MLTKQLANILQRLQAPGRFYATGTLEVFPPCLEVKQIGRVALPLLPLQAKQLVEVAERAPYGKGYETLVDTEVRRTWQINANQVSLSGKYWAKNLADIVKRVKLDLGVDCAVTAELYKLLVYDKGSFFVPHRDTEKTDGMFATLIIVLPSLYSGGELIVRHQQEAVTLDLLKHEPEEIAYAAFYADCIHEVLPVTDGCRLTLVYNLVRSNKKIPLPTPPDYQQAQQDVTDLLCNWQQSLQNKTATDDTTPEKLIFLLEHEYSIAELSFAALKNADAASAEVLIAAAQQTDCELYLALISVEESGSAEYTGYGYHSHWDDDSNDADDFEIGEVFDHWEKISEWHSPDGSRPVLPTLPFKAEEFCPPEDFEKMEPGDVEFQEATGNAGASFERMYHCAALVLWPRSHYLKIINQAGLTDALLVLKDLCQQWSNTHQETIKQDALTLATYILNDWLTEHCAQSNAYKQSQHIPDYLSCVVCLADLPLLNTFWSIIATTGIYQKEHSSALAKTAERLPWADVVGYATATIAISAMRAQEACTVLLVDLCSKRTENECSQLSHAALALFTSLPGDPQRFPEQPAWRQQSMVPNADAMADIILNFSMIDPDLAEKMLDYLLAWPATYNIDQLLLPAALRLTQTASNEKFSVVTRLRQVVMTHLQSRLAELLAPPTDWRRESTTGCSCADCKALNQFLLNPEQAQWNFKAAETRRTHIQHVIGSHKCDIDYVTEKKSRPYSMVCSKNQASYQRLVKQHQGDQKALARLQAVDK